MDISFHKSPTRDTKSYFPTFPFFVREKCVRVSPPRPGVFMVQCTWQLICCVQGDKEIMRVFTFLYARREEEKTLG